MTPARTRATTPVPLTKDIAGLVALFLTSGSTHLVRPQVFEPLMPRALPRHRAIIYASGVAELLCAAGLLHPRTRKVAGYASAILLVGVFPGNVQMSAGYARRAPPAPGHRVARRLRGHAGEAAAAAPADPNRPEGHRASRLSASESAPAPE
jgi:uncharacterized membrane protein